MTIALQNMKLMLNHPVRRAKSYRYSYELKLDEKSGESIYFHYFRLIQ